MNSNKKSFLKTSSYAVFSQVVSLCCGLVTSLLLPKILGIEQFGYWQYFFLCSSYVGLLHFGFSDGIYLALGGKKFSEINRKQYYPQLQLVSFLQMVIALLVALYSYLFLKGAYQVVFYFLGVYIIIENVYKLLSFVLMATDKMRYYSKTVVIDKVTFLGLLFVFLVLFNKDSFVNVIFSYLCARFIALAFVSTCFGRFFDFTVTSNLFVRNNLRATCGNMIVGISLTISNLLSTFIIDSGRFFVEHNWGISVFAKISFAVSLSMFVLTFISQIGLVLFPYLCRMEKDKQRQMLDMLTFVIGLFAMVCFIGFVPLSLIIKTWIPKYVDSLSYLMILCPIALFETRMVLVFGTYFKTFRKQIVLLKINLASVLFAVFFYYLSSNVVNCINMLVMGMLVSIMLRSYLCQFYLYRYLNVKLDRFVICMEILTSVFMILAYNLFASMLLFSLVYVVSLTILALVRKEKIKYSYLLIKS